MLCTFLHVPLMWSTQGRLSPTTLHVRTCCLYVHVVPDAGRSVIVSVLLKQIKSMSRGIYSITGVHVLSFCMLLKQIKSMSRGIRIIFNNRSTRAIILYVVEINKINVVWYKDIFNNDKFNNRRRCTFLVHVAPTQVCICVGTNSMAAGVGCNL